MLDSVLRTFTHFFKLVWQSSNNELIPVIVSSDSGMLSGLPGILGIGELTTETNHFCSSMEKKTPPARPKRSIYDSTEIEITSNGSQPGGARSQRRFSLALSTSSRRHAFLNESKVNKVNQIGQSSVTKGLETKYVNGIFKGASTKRKNKAEIASVWGSDQYVVFLVTLISMENLPFNYMLKLYSYQEKGSFLLIFNY